MAEDEDLIRRCLRELGLAGARLDHYASVSGAGSGAQVFRLALDGGVHAVLKVTTAPDREQARRELAFWQVTTRGHGPEDFALLWSRANADGGRPPVDDMRAAYAGVRGLPDDDVLHRAMVASRIRLELFGWPDRLPHFDVERQRRIVGQLAGLAERW
ncbi:hypothetical protein [Flindersiella endophytica]